MTQSQFLLCIEFDRNGRVNQNYQIVQKDEVFQITKYDFLNFKIRNEKLTDWCWDISGIISPKSGASPRTQF